MVRYVRGEVVALIDSDNIFPERDWIGRMVGPFEDEDAAVENIPDFEWV